MLGRALLLVVLLISSCYVVFLMLYTIKQKSVGFCADTLRTQKPTWRLWLWNTCHPTYSQWTCRKQVTKIDRYWSRRKFLGAGCFYMQFLFLCFFLSNPAIQYFPQFLSPAWTPLCSCESRRDRTTSWWSLKQTSRGQRSFCSSFIVSSSSLLIFQVFRTDI